MADLLTTIIVHMYMGHSPRNVENGVRILSLNGVTLPGKLEQCNYHESSH